MVVYSGRTVEQAIEKGLKDLNLPRMKAHIKVISREKKGFLGFGKKPARVSVEPINEKIAHEIIEKLHATSKNSRFLRLDKFKPAT